MPDGDLFNLILDIHQSNVSHESIQAPNRYERKGQAWPRLTAWSILQAAQNEVIWIPVFIYTEYTEIF